MAHLAVYMKQHRGPGHDSPNHLFHSHMHSYFTSRHPHSRCSSPEPQGAHPRVVPRMRLPPACLVAVPAHSAQYPRGSAIPPSSLLPDPWRLPVRRGSRTVDPTAQTVDELYPWDGNAQRRGMGPAILLR